MKHKPHYTARRRRVVSVSELITNADGTVTLKKIPPKKKPTPKEADIQTAFFNRVKSLELAYPLVEKLVFSVNNHNSLYSRIPKHFKFAAINKAKAEGMKTGVADVLCLLPEAFYGTSRIRDKRDFHNRYTYLAIEFKSEKGRQSDDQKKFQKHITEAGGVYVSYRDADEAFDFLKKYLGTN
jgi:hypothetical protein